MNGRRKDGCEGEGGRKEGEYKKGIGGAIWRREAEEW